jgi:sodium transport system permease protein
MRSMNPAIVIARKEVVDGLRDVRSVISALLYALMGPVVVGLVSISIANQASARPEASASVLIGMTSVFTLVAAFVGGMNVAMDTVAGERERRSLLPLLLNPVRRRDILTGKWLAVGFFSIAGLGINLLGFAVVFAAAGMHTNEAWSRVLLVMMAGIFPLTLLAASLQLWISTVCRTVKEAQTYLSMLVFLPMGLGMFLVFFPRVARGWCRFLPVAGQQLQLQSLMRGGMGQPAQPIVLGCLTAMLAMLVLQAAASRLQRDEIIYGN